MEIRKNLERQLSPFIYQALSELYRSGINTHVAWLLPIMKFRIILPTSRHRSADHFDH
jgi:hypothetical protein